MSVKVAVWVLLCCACAGAQAQDRAQAWKEVEAALAKGQPKMAVELLVPIEREAQANRRWAEAVKAVAQRVDAEVALRGGRQEEALPLLRAETDRAPDPMRPFLQLLLAHHSWQYYCANRGRFCQRTRAEGAETDEIATWSLPRILAEIEAQFTRALSYEPVLKGVPVGAYGALLEKGSLPDAYRPTLFDFIAHEMLAFYALGEQAGAQWEDEIEVSAEGPAFQDASAFMFPIPEAAAERSHVLRALRLFQKLMAFHEKDADLSAYADADLNRLQFCRNQVSDDKRDELYAAALDRFIHKWKKHEIMSRASALRAQLAAEADEPGLARLIAQNGAAAYPASIGAAQCRNLIAEIEAPALRFSAERVWCEPWPEMTIAYKNLREAHFRAVPVTFEEMYAGAGPGSFLSEERVAFLLRRKPAKAWSVQLPPSTDYKEQTFSQPVPKSLPPGLYRVFASSDGTFGEGGSPVFDEVFCVSRLALAVEPGRNGVKGYVLTAREGEPVAGTRVEVWTLDRKDSCKRSLTVTTGPDGSFAVAGDNAGYLLLRASKGDESAQTWNGVWKGNERERDLKPEARIAFFSDRALYRPGQQVQYKGVYFVVDRQDGRGQTVDGKGFTVRFKDAAGQVIAEQAVKSNDYGSFSGSFTVPRDRGTGTMTIEVEKLGTLSVHVEEYKRPTFDVSLEPAAPDARLGSVVSLGGRAETFSGAPVSGAKVVWRVSREASLADPWSPQTSPGGGQEMARGVATSDGDGRFSVTFFAKGELRAKKPEEAVYTFRVAADVTDAAGETRSSERLVELGASPWQALVACDGWQTAGRPVDLTVEVCSRNGEGVATTGQLQVFTVKQPARVVRGKVDAAGAPVFSVSSAGNEAPDDPESWPDDEEVASEAVKTSPDGRAKGRVPLKAGLYRIRFATRDPAGTVVASRQLVRVIEPASARFPLKEPDYFEAEAWSLQPGQAFRAVWGSGYGSARAVVVVEQNGRELMRLKTARGVTQQQIEFPVTEEMRGGVTVRTLCVRENRLYARCRTLDVPWTNKRLGLRWERFTSRLEPGKPETWSLVISDSGDRRAVAEVVASLYDRSLDAFLDQPWVRSFEEAFTRYSGRTEPVFSNGAIGSQNTGTWTVKREPDAWTYRSWPGTFRPPSAVVSMAASAADPFAVCGAPTGAAAASGEASFMSSETAGPRPLRAVKPRRNLQETAFFMPHLVSDTQGTVALRFTVPETLTGWRFRAFVHDQALRSGYLEAEAETVKALTVEPNPPRLVRAGDEVAFAVKVTNRSPARQEGRVRVTFAEAETLASADARLGNAEPERAFALEPGASATVEWRLRVPDGLGPLTYQATAAAERFTDGEEGGFPVLPRRVTVRETLPLTLRGKKTKSFTFDALAASKASKTLRHQGLTVQMVPQPAWCAVLSLPYLMEYPHACCEQTFNRYYANALASHVAAGDPKIRAVFDAWKGTDALRSPLERHPALKAVMAEETPWGGVAAGGSEARRNVGALFDEARMKAESQRALASLGEMRLADGTWPWFPGGRRNDLITLYIVAGFGRLRHLGAGGDVALALQALPRLDAWMAETQAESVKRGGAGEVPLAPTHALYLYARSFFLKDLAVEPGSHPALGQLLEQAKRTWPKLGRQAQGHVALALSRWGEGAVAQEILKSLRDRATQDDTQGMYWRDTEGAWDWFQAPVETQALMIEALLEVAGDAASAEACQVWLLRQKQVQDWRSTKATADAVCALLMGGRALLGSEAQVEVSLGGVKIEPERAEAGTGFYEKRFAAAEVSPDLAKIKVSKRDEGVSWGAVHWQYEEALDALKPSGESPLAVRKQLFVKTYTARGAVLRPAAGAIPQGSELVTRLEVRADRDLAFVHLKDSRAGCAEPVNVLSRNVRQDGLDYYESTRDAATHFFFDVVPKGVHVLEYSCRVQQKGVFFGGLAEIECLYAPECRGHSDAAVLRVE